LFALDARGRMSGAIATEKNNHNTTIPQRPQQQQQ
jgi:hypothetical protein